jgi:glycosyltransferase involved in cell wall biosynthesis
MVIAHVVSSLAMGGQERLVVELARRQRPDAEAVLAVSLDYGRGRLCEELCAAGVEVVAVAKRPGLDPTLSPRLYRLLRRRGVDLVHTHNRMPLVYAAPAGKLAGARVVHTKHGPGVGTPRERWLRRQAARFTDAYVAVSAETATTGKGDCAPEKLAVVENGVDVDSFRPDAQARAEVRRELGLGDTDWVVGTVGRLAREKDQALLLRAMFGEGRGPDERLFPEERAFPLSPRVRGRGEGEGLGLRAGIALAGETHATSPLPSPPRRTVAERANDFLVVVGEGPEESALRGLGESLGVADRVRFLGARGDVPRLLAAFDAFALTSRMEGLPLALLEAMAVGVPVLVTEVGAMPALVRRAGAGVVAAAGDESAVRAGLRTLATDQAQAMGAAGRREVVARHSVERMVGRYWALYQAS